MGCDCWPQGTQEHGAETTTPAAQTRREGRLVEVGSECWEVVIYVNFYVFIYIPQALRNKIKLKLSLKNLRFEKKKNYVKYL